MTISTGNSYLDSLANTASTSTTTKASNGGNQTLTQSDFLKLLTTQMQAQDPLNPTDNTQMVAQMAQFSATTGIAEMNQSLTNIASTLSASRVGDVANWIGKNALVNSATSTPLSDGSYAGTVTLPSAASQVGISLSDSKGNIVYSGVASNVAAGDIPFFFDGKDSSGNAIPGPLNITVTAQDTSGKSMSTSTSSWTSISGVQSPASGTTKLVTGLGTIDPTTALQIS
jgi:flagellar basal-body rod modification protein FlgD